MENNKTVLNLSYVKVGEVHPVSSDEIRDVAAVVDHITGRWELICDNGKWTVKCLRQGFRT